MRNNISNTTFLTDKISSSIVNGIIVFRIEKFFNPAAEIVIPVGMPTNEANAEIETQSLTAEIKIRKCSK